MTGAGAKAGVDARISYRGHTAPVMSVDFHPARGPVDLGDLVLSSSIDWSVKLWKVRAPAATSTVVGAGAGAGEGVVSPLMDFIREDLVYDAAWSPIKPGVFSLVDGAGWLELWDITVETEEPVARISPTQRQDARSMLSNSLNKVAWEQSGGQAARHGRRGRSPDRVRGRPGSGREGGPEERRVDQCQEAGEPDRGGWSQRRHGRVGLADAGPPQPRRTDVQLRLGTK